MRRAAEERHLRLADDHLAKADRNFPRNQVAHELRRRGA